MEAELNKTISELRNQNAALLAHSEQAEQIIDDLRAQLARAAAQVRGLVDERNTLIIERNNATVRALKAENPTAAGARFAEAMPNDRLDDVLPLARVLPLNLPASLDLRAMAAASTNANGERIVGADDSEEAVAST